jgi:hypothetical protein
MTQPAYVFVVGSSRTGTSMLRSALNKSRDVAICDETHFLGDPKAIENLIRYLLNGSRKAAGWSETYLLGKLANRGVREELAMVGDISTDAGAEEIVDHIYGTFQCWNPKNVDRREFLRCLLASDRTDQSLFELVMACHANGKPIRGEKTPAHIHYVSTLLKWFPNAKIIHTFRDPRAIFVLQRERPYTRKGLNWRHRMLRRSASLLEIYLSFNVIISWLRIVQLHHRYQQLYPNNYYLLKYEDLVDAPRIHLGRLCGFLGIELTEGMLQTISQDSSPCPQLQGSDTRSAYWQKHLHPITNKWFVLLCKKHLQEFGYQH